MRLFRSLLPLALALPILVSPLAVAQDEPADDSPFLDGDQVELTDPPMRVSRPNDSWQLVDLEKVREQRRAKGMSNSSYATLVAHMWYGAARANVFVRCWKIAAPPKGDKPADELLADGFQRELEGILRNPKLGKRKRVKVGKRPGIWFEIQGEAPDPRDPDKMLSLTIMKIVAFRPDDNAIFTVSLEFSDAKRAKDLTKELKKLLKKVKF